MIRSNSPRPRNATIPEQSKTPQSDPRHERRAAGNPGANVFHDDCYMKPPSVPGDPLSEAQDSKPAAQPTVADGPRRSLRNRMLPRFADEMPSRGGSNLTASRGAASAQIEDSKPAVRRSNRIIAAAAMRAVESNRPMEDTKPAAKPSAEPSVKRRGTRAPPQLLSNKRSRQLSPEVTRPDGPSIATAGGPSQAKPAAATPVKKDPFPMNDGWEALDIVDSALDGADHVAAVPAQVEIEQISKATSQGLQEISEVTRPDGPSIAIASDPSQAKPAAATPAETGAFPIDDGCEALDILALLNLERVTRHAG